MPDEPQLPSREGGRSPAAEARPELPGRGELPSGPGAGPGGEPVSSPGSDAAGPVGGAAAASLAERIAAATAAGGLTALPDDFGETNGDWQCIRADDPFERLYLDWRQPERLTPVIVRRHYDLLDRFWAEKVRAMHAGPARLQLARRYGGRYASPEMVDSFPGELKKAYDQLATAEQLRAACEERAGARLRHAYERLEPLVRQSLLDGVLSPDEGKALLQEGAALGLSRDEVAAFVLRSLAERGFQPGEPVGGASPADQIAAIRWASPGAHRSPRASNAFNFEQATVYTLPELADACTRFPREAAGYLLDGYLERWVAGDLGLAPLAGRVKRITGELRDTPRRALAVFVRTILDQAGIDASPRLVLEPPMLELGTVTQGEGAVGYMTVREENGRHAWGRIAAGQAPAGFQFPPAFEGSGRCELILDSAWTPPGRYEVELRLEAEGAVHPVMARVRFEVLPLAVRVVPDSLDFALRFGQKAERSVSVATADDRGRLLATASLADAIPGLAVSGGVDGRSGEISVQMDASRVRAGTRRSTELVLASNAGERRIPVRVEVGFDRLGTVAWTVAGAVLGGGSMLGLRSIVAGAAGGSRWILGPSQAEGLYLAATLVMAVLAGGIYVAAALLRKIPAPPAPDAAGTALPEAAGGRSAGGSFGVLGLAAAAVFTGGWLIVHANRARTAGSGVSSSLSGADTTAVVADTTLAAPAPLVTDTTVADAVPVLPAPPAPPPPPAAVAEAPPERTARAGVAGGSSADGSPRADGAPTLRTAAPPAADEPARSAYAAVYDELQFAQEAMNQGDYAGVRQTLRRSSERLAHLDTRYPRSQTLAELNTRVSSLLTRAGSACNAEADLVRRRGGTPPACD